MLRSILLALDDAPGAVAARDLAFALARRRGLAVTAAAILGQPGEDEAPEAVPLGAAAFAEHRNAALAARREAGAEAALAAARAAAGDLPVSLRRLQDAAVPALLQAATGHDLIVLGRDSSLGEEPPEDGLAPAIEALLQDGARPLLVVPPGVPARAEGPVLVGYDASLPCVRSLQLFALLGLADDSYVRVMSVHADAARAQELARDGVEYCSRQGLAAEPWPVTGDHPATLLLAEAEAMGARLLVMGAFAHGGLRTLLLGSATRELLRAAPCPVFVHR